MAGLLSELQTGHQQLKLGALGFVTASFSPPPRLNPRPEEEEEEEEKGPGFSRSHVCLIISDLTTC